MTELTKPLGLASIDIPKDTVIGEKRRGTLCIGPEDLVWRRNEPLTFREGEYHREFTQIVTAANFRVPDKPKSLFDAPSLSGTELVIAAQIPTVRENVCSAIDSFGTGRGMYMEIRSDERRNATRATVDA